MYDLYGVLDNNYLYLGEKEDEYFNFCLTWYDKEEEHLMGKDYPEQPAYYASGHENPDLVYLKSFDTEDEAWAYAKTITAKMPPVHCSHVPRRAPRVRVSE